MPDVVNVDTGKNIAMNFSLQKVAPIESPPMLLRDLKLKKQNFDLLSNTLNEYITIDPAKAERRGKEVEFTVIKYNNDCRFLLEISNEILALKVGDPQDIFDAIETVFLIFKHEQNNQVWDKTWNNTLYIIHRGEPAVDASIDLFISRELPNDIEGIRVKFVCFSQSVGALPLAKRQKYIKWQLELSSSDKIDLLGNFTYEEKQDLAEIIADLSQFQTVNGRRNLVQTLGEGFDQMIREFQWEAPAQDVAENLIDCFIKRSIRFHDNSFVMFLGHLKRLGEKGTMRSHQLTLIDNILKKYELKTLHEEM